MSHPSSLAIASEVTATFGTAGIKKQAYLQQIGENVHVNIELGFVRWQVHELPVDYSVEPKLRCRPEYVGRFLHSGEDKDYIYNVTTASLVLHSLVLFADDRPVACAPITPFQLPSIAASVVFKSGVFGKIHLVQWRSGEHSNDTQNDSGFHTVARRMHKNYRRFGSPQLLSSAI